MPRTLPQGWKIEENFCIDEGSGMGDDRYATVLFRFSEVAAGHLWWKRRVWRWVPWSFERYGSMDRRIALLTRRAWSQVKAEIFAKEIHEHV